MTIGIGLLLVAIGEQLLGLAALFALTTSHLVVQVLKRAVARLMTALQPLIASLPAGYRIEEAGSILETYAPRYLWWVSEALHALIDHAFGDLDHEALQASARVTNPASRRVLEKCGFQWTGVGLCRVRAIHSSAPVDRFRLERGIWASLKSWGKMRRVG